MPKEKKHLAKLNITIDGLHFAYAFTPLLCKDILFLF